MDGGGMGRDVGQKEGTEWQENKCQSRSANALPNTTKIFMAMQMASA